MLRNQHTGFFFEAGSMLLTVSGTVLLISASHNSTRRGPKSSVAETAGSINYERTFLERLYGRSSCRRQSCRGALTAGRFDGPSFALWDGGPKSRCNVVSRFAFLARIIL